MTALETLSAAARDRILVIDGAMGTMIQTYGLTEADYRGSRFGNWHKDLKGNNDLLNIARPDVIFAIHDAFLAAGADIVETNTFNGTSISQADYDLEAAVRDINLEGVKRAREAADAWTAKTPEKPRFVAGAVGPMNRSLSVSPDVNRPGFRAITFDQAVDAYKEQIGALLEGGADLVLIETVFDTLNAKAAIFAAQTAMEEGGREVPLMLSGTITDMSGRNLSGQTVEAFWHSVRHARPFSMGLNCAFGADQMRPHVLTLKDRVDTLLCIYPNAGLPNEFGAYDESPCDMAQKIAAWADEGLLNIVGGCCGTTPGHIRHIAEAVQGKRPRTVPVLEPKMRLSGLDAMTIG